MRNASYDPVRDSIILEPGIHWQEAVSALEPFGVAPVGGKIVPFLYRLVLTGYLIHSFIHSRGTSMQVVSGTLLLSCSNLDLSSRASDVGTGLLLGGGLSWLSPSQGYAADNFKELDVVLVNGSAITVTATNAYSDLFRALKGGGNRFGIVTRYELFAVHTGTKDDQTWFGGQMIVRAASGFFESNFLHASRSTLLRKLL